VAHKEEMVRSVVEKNDKLKKLIAKET